LEEEERRYFSLKQELKDLETGLEQELEDRDTEHNLKKEHLSKKYEEKLQLYKDEIERKNEELKNIEKSITEEFTNILDTQTSSFNNMYEEYVKVIEEMKFNIEKNLKKLIYDSAQLDEELYTNKKEYEDLIMNFNKKMQEELKKDNDKIQNFAKDLKDKQIKESEFKNELDKKINESDKIIQKNAQIKQNIIDTTQKTITLQEQLLETEKNIKKIEKKENDLVIKNKHLEQIRFVLEHRMTSLEKEKAPLEGECKKLERQKGNLQEEFNKLILQINSRNQFLENKQSQLKTCLVQTFEINDQIEYMEKKLTHLQNEVSKFVKYYSNNNLSFEESKATKVALKLRQLYEKYLSKDIDEELINYKFYLNKLKEETEKINISNNLDLIMRDKGEEKLISEKFKLEQLKDQKEKAFKKMQGENTELIAECNRLRKNLHEVYMHVVDIQHKFEDLTKINPNLNKTEIVYQIKDFIKQTHHKIKSNFDGTEDENVYNNGEEYSNLDYFNNSQPVLNKLKNSINEKGFKDMIRSVDSQQEIFNQQNMSIDKMKVKIIYIYIYNILESIEKYYCG
jgi:hypothetical protein